MRYVANDTLLRLSIWAAEKGREKTTWCGVLLFVNHLAVNHSAADLLAAVSSIGPVLCAAYLVAMKDPT